MSHRHSVRSRWGISKVLAVGGRLGSFPPELFPLGEAEVGLAPCSTDSAVSAMVSKVSTRTTTSFNTCCVNNQWLQRAGEYKSNFVQPLPGGVGGKGAITGRKKWRRRVVGRRGSSTQAGTGRKGIILDTLN